MTWVAGQTCLSRAVHSMPDMPGRLMSIKTTSGVKAGSSLSAEFPSGQDPTQRKPGAWLMSRVKLRRRPESSSTTPTLANRPEVEDAGDGTSGGVPVLTGA